jgi:hypothetical protein
MRILREIALANSTIGRYRISTLAHYFWCGEQAYWQARGIEDGRAEQQKRVGTDIHEHISQQHKRWTWEVEFLKQLDKYRHPEFGFIRKVGKENIFWDVSGHPDEFQVTIGKKVSLVELKTTEMNKKSADFFMHYRLPMAMFQCQAYCFVLEPIIKELGYYLDTVHAVQVWHVQYRREKGQKILVGHDCLGDFPVFYYPSSTERELLAILEAFRDHSKVIPPRGAPNGFKCRQCPQKYKEKCQFCLKANKSS